jgi:hypothetical protein
LIQRVDLLLLAPHRLDGHAAGDRQSLRVIGHRDPRPAALARTVGQLRDRLDTIAPGRVHLEVAAIVLERDDAGNRQRQQAHDFGAAEEPGTQDAAPGDVVLAPTRGNRLLDSRGVTMLEHFVNDA